MRSLKIFWVLLVSFSLIAFIGGSSRLMASSGPSHATHFFSDKGPRLPLNESGCYFCHADGRLQCQGAPVFADDEFSANTTVCNPCHSEGGIVDGVNDPVIGAKANWDEGVYQSNGEALQAGKEQWCVSCHDDGTSVCDGVSAPNVDLYYTSGHGRNGIVECLVCHDATFAHIDGEPRTYAFNDEDVDPADGTSDIYVPGNSGVAYASGYRLRYVFETGTHTGGTHATVLTDTSASWTTDEFIGQLLENTTDGSSGSITANTATTVTVLALAGGSDNQWENGDAYRIRLVPLMVPSKSGPTFGADRYRIRYAGFRLCFECHDSSKILFDDMPTDENSLNTNFKLSDPDPPRQYTYYAPSNDRNIHFSHMLGLSIRYWDSDWDTATAQDSGALGCDAMITCSSCHNVHGTTGTLGSTTEPMVRDGRLVGREPGYGFSYVIKKNATPWPPGGDSMVTSDGATQSNSIGAIFRNELDDTKMCGGGQTGCHIDYTGQPQADYDAAGIYLEYYRATVASDCSLCHAYGTEASHPTHDDSIGKGVDLDCYDCHDTSGHINSTVDFVDGNPLSTTHACDACHSQGGAIDGVAIAKANWEGGVYEADGTLKVGKEQWCAGCHDDVPSVVNSNSAPDICGDNATYGYYLGAHGNATYGVKHQSIGSAQGECVHCHNAFVNEVTLGFTPVTGPPSRIIDESFEGPRYQEMWTESVGSGCSLEPDSLIPGPSPTGAGYQCLQSISDATGYKAVSTLDYGSEESKTFTRMYLYVEDEGLDNDGDKKKIGALEDSGNNTVFIFRLYQSGDQLQFNLRVYNNDDWNDYYANISSSTWHRIEVKYDDTNDAWDWRLDGTPKENDGGILTGIHRTGIQEWNLGFMNGNQAETGTIYFDQVSVDNNDWVGEAPSAINLPHGGWLFAAPLVDQETGFCFRCHTDPAFSRQISVPDQYTYSHVRGGGTDLICPDNIKEAFAFIDITASPQFNCNAFWGSAHYLADVREYVKEMWGWGDVVEEIDPCMGCHNPHRAKSGWPCSKAGGHSDASTWEVWGDESGEKMADYVDSLAGVYGVYQPPYRYPYTGDVFEWADASQAPDYVSVCLECHRQTENNNFSLVYSTRYGQNLGGPEWYEEGASGLEVHGAGTQTAGGVGSKKPPYDNGDPNYILMCTDCHEPHGSQNHILLRSFVNGRDKSDVFVNTDRHDASPPTGAKNNQILEWCKACHTVDTHGVGSDPDYPQNSCFDCHYHGHNHHF
jgi:hypothetical protein